MSIFFRYCRYVKVLLARDCQHLAIGLASRGSHYGCTFGTRSIVGEVGEHGTEYPVENTKMRIVLPSVSSECAVIQTDRFSDTISVNGNNGF